MCPIVPTFTCGFVRSYFALAMEPSYGRTVPRVMEPMTGLEPATPSLEGWRSTTELFPHLMFGMVGRGGFEPPKASASRFTVRPLWPLGYLPTVSRHPGARTPKCLEDMELARGFEPPTG